VITIMSLYRGKLYHKSGNLERDVNLINWPFKETVTPKVALE